MNYQLIFTKSYNKKAKKFFKNHKNLLKQYQKALDLFDQQSKMSSDFTITMALKACTKLNDYQRGINIQRQLSSKSLENPFIQTSLIHFYSKSLIY